MARIRTIKPEFWSDEKLSECSLSARLLFMGLISFADDAGRLEYSPQRFRLQIFPCGSVTVTSLIEWIGELSEHSLIRIYTVDSREYLDIPGFAKHQKINRPTPSKHPDFSRRTHEGLTENSLTPIAGLEGNGSSTTAAKRPSAKAIYPPEFEEIRRAYPKRAGGNPWHRAWKAVHARLAEGITWGELAEGVRRYAEFIRVTGKEGTEFVQQAARFFGPGKEFENDWTPPVKPQVAAMQGGWQ